MKSVLARASLRYLRLHPAQLVLAVLGVAIGVAVVVGIDTASASAREAFERAADELSGGATHVIRGGPQGVDERVFVELALDPLAPPAVPVIDRTLPHYLHPGRPVRLLGVDPFLEARFRESFRGPLGAAAGALMTGHNAGALARSFALERGLALGDELVLVIGGRNVGVRVAALFEASSALPNLLVVDIATAQELLGEPGRIDRVDLALLDDAAAREGALERIRARLPSDCTLESASTQAATIADATQAFDLSLRALGFVALLVGVFLVYNTMTFSVVQRRPLWGTLRAIGATRGELFRLVCGEALAIGVVGTAIGIALGLWLSRGLSQLVARTINDLYYRVSVRELAIEPRVLIEAIALGLGVTLVGAFLPARNATTTPPRATLDRAEPEAKLRARAGRLAWVGAAIGAAACALLAASGKSLLLGFVALFLVFLGASLIVPLATIGACRVLAPLAGAIAGHIGRAAVRGIASHLARSSVAIAALTVALAASSAMGIMVASFRITVERWLSWTLTPDVYVSVPSSMSNRDTQTLPPGAIERARSFPGVVGCNVLRDLDLRTTSGEAVFVTATELVPSSHDAYRLLARSAGDPWEAFERGDGAFVSEALARRIDLRVGAELAFASPRGPRAFTVVGVFRDYSTDRGWAMFSRRAYEATWNDPGISSLGLFAAPGVDAEELVRDLWYAFDPEFTLNVYSRESLIAGSLAVFDRTFTVTRVLRWLSGLVAFLGVAGALLAMALEREREFGVMRAIGLSPGGLRGLVLGQTGVLGAIAGLFAVPVGIAAALVLIFVINARSFGWTLDVEIEPSVLLQTFALAVGASLLAGIPPALRMARRSPAQVLRGD